MFLHWIQNSVNIYMLFQTRVFVLWNAKEDILNYSDDKTVSVPTDVLLTFSIKKIIVRISSFAFCRRCE